MSRTMKEQILHEASRMVLKKGLNGFSLQELASALNLKKASLFHHYPSKSSLALELYRFYQKAFVEWTAANSRLSPERQILSYAEELTRWICDKKRVCPVGALSLEWHQLDPELQDQIKVLHKLQKDWLTTLFKSMKKTSGLNVSINDAVICTMTMLQGSIQMARLLDEPGMVKNNLRSYLKSIKPKSV
jgi:TetR/AcrR family transcriptional repressor of nem operon